MQHSSSLKDSLPTQYILDAPSTVASARPFIKWAGGKRQLLPTLHQNLPKKFNRYFEPMLGAGALFFSLQPAEAKLSDVNKDLIDTYIVVRDQLDALIASLSRYEYTAECYYTTRNLDRCSSYQSLCSIERAARFIYLNRTCYNGLYRVNAKGQFNVPFGSYKNPTICDAQGLARASTALQSSTLQCASFETITADCISGDFVYFDPPYAPVSPTANFTSYTQSGFSYEKQLALRDLCLHLDAQGVYFLLSNSSVPLVHELYEGFNVQVVSANRAINSRSSKRGAVEEVLVKNY